jgi:Tol biopolymer transport system component
MHDAMLAGALAWAIVLVACHADVVPPAARTAVTYSSPMWYEETARCFQLAPDGKLAAYGPGPRTRVYDVGSAAVRSDAWPATVDNTRGALFDANGRVAALGTVGGRNRWYSINQGAPVPLGVPPQALPRWAPRTSRLAYFTPGDPTIAVEDGATARVVRLDGAVNGLAWTPLGDALFAITLHPNGLSSLSRLSLDGAVHVVRSDLDASPYFNTLAITDDGGRVFLALAGEAPPDPKVRHDPDAPHRDLDIYALDLRSGQLQNVMSAPADDFCPAIAAGWLYWTHNDPAPQVVTFPLEGGEAKTVADHGFLPRWHPSGRHIAFTRAYYRLSDYGLDMDGWTVDVDGSGASTAAPRSWIAGFGEDMGPVWSPNGQWVAYHSHRSATAVPLYESPGRTDDTWLMRASGGPEIRLTDFGLEVGPPDWAPDGSRLVFDSWDRDGPPRFAKPWIVTIDPESGRSLRATRMPLPPGVAGITGEAWSPHDDDIAFIERIDDVRRALWVSRADGGGARKLIEFRSYTIGGVAWTPDARELLYSALASDDRMQIFAIAAAGDAPRQITHADANMLHPSVSPDGRFVAASRIPWHKELRRMPLQER